VALFDRDPAESKPAYHAFRAYRDYGPGRSIDKVWRQRAGITDDAQRAPRYWWQWSSDHAWVRRAEAYDQHCEQVEQAKFEAELKRLAKRRAKFQLEFQDVVEERFREMRTQLKQASAAPAVTMRREETIEAVRDEKGRITAPAKVVVTDVKGINLAGEARLNAELRETGIQAATGPFANQAEKSSAEIPPFIVQLATDDQPDASTDANLPRQ